MSPWVSIILYDLWPYVIGTHLLLRLKCLKREWREIWVSLIQNERKLYSKERKEKPGKIILGESAIE